MEVADTHLGVPGPALVRRWKRESPNGFLFTALAPKELIAEAFKPTAAGDAAWQAFVPVARELDAPVVVVPSPPDLPPGKTHRATVRTFFERLLAESAPFSLAWEAPATWSLKDAEATVKDLAVEVIRDPFHHPPITRGKRALYRLPGPAGFKSRYEDPALEAVAETLAGTKADDIWVFFANVDMYSDAKRLRRLIDG